MNSKQLQRKRRTLLLLELGDGGRQRPTEEQLATGLDVAFGRFGVEVVVRQPVVALVKVREAADALLDGRQTLFHHPVRVRKRLLLLLLFLLLRLLPFLDGGGLRLFRSLHLQRPPMSSVERQVSKCNAVLHLSYHDLR